jgi:hypothetical protein
MQIEALEDIKSGNYILTAGDRITVPDEVGTHWVEMGWANDTSGTVPTGVRSTAPRTVSLSGAAHAATARV